MFKRFIFNRNRDVSGVSGTGLVAQGCTFDNGKVAIAWIVDGKPKSTVIYDSVDDAIGIHGHEGGTLIEWIDD